ncbi:hypothetical protein JST99_02990 [Candidatus Dependentiae bacterium]|nr:hypothetical protein [Candidatus Dependentiae bacterium]MCC7414808.1 hypothetical protein [Campylobacterota bacterium]
MSIKLHKPGYEQALKLITGGLEVIPDAGNWDEVQPTENEVVVYLDTHSLKEYGLWFLGIDTSKPENDPARYVYPYGDLKVVHECALIIAEEDAMDNNLEDIEQAAGVLLDMIEQDDE